MLAFKVNISYFRFFSLHVHFHLPAMKMLIYQLQTHPFDSLILS